MYRPATAQSLDGARRQLAPCVLYETDGAVRLDGLEHPGIELDLQPVRADLQAPRPVDRHRAPDSEAAVGVQHVLRADVVGLRARAVTALWQARRARAVRVVDDVQDTAIRHAAGEVGAAAVPDQDARRVLAVDALDRHVVRRSAG